MSEPSMVKAPPLYTTADAALINLAAGSLIDPMRAPEILSDDVEMMRRILPRVSRDHVRIRDLAAACEAMVESYHTRHRMEVFSPWQHARLDAAIALAEIFRHRLSGAWRSAFPDDG